MWGEYGKVKINECSSEDLKILFYKEEDLPEEDFNHYVEISIESSRTKELFEFILRKSEIKEKNVGHLEGYGKLESFIYFQKDNEEIEGFYKEIKAINQAVDTILKIEKKGIKIDRYSNFFNEGAIILAETLTDELKDLFEEKSKSLEIYRVYFPNFFDEDIMIKK